MIVAAIVIVGIILISTLIASLSGAPWLPARQSDTAAMLKNIATSHESSAIEFGCGDGRNLQLIHSMLPDTELVGVEFNPLLWLVARIRTRNYASIVLGNAWHYDVSRFDIVLTFLIPNRMNKLESKLHDEMKPGAQFISYIFPLPTVKSLYHANNYYHYTAPFIKL